MQKTMVFFYCSFFVAAFTMANMYGVEKPKISRQCLRIEAGKIMPQKMKRKIWLSALECTCLQLRDCYLNSRYRERAPKFDLTASVCIHLPCKLKTLSHTHNAKLYDGYGNWPVFCWMFALIGSEWSIQIDYVSNQLANQYLPFNTCTTHMPCL